MKKALIVAQGAEAKTSLTLVIIKYSAPPPRKMGGGVNFPFDDNMFVIFNNLQSAAEGKKCGHASVQKYGFCILIGCEIKR